MNKSVLSKYLKDKNVVYPSVLVLIALFLRFWGITYGLPSVYNSTEYFIAKQALSFGARHTLEPLYFVYPSLYSYFIAVLFGFYFLVGHLIGNFPTTADFAIQFFIDPSVFYLFGRISNGIFFIIALLIFYRISRFYLNAKSGFFFSLLFLFCINMQTFTFWMVPDSLLLLGMVIVLYYLVKLEKKNISYRELIFASVVCGLTVSTKYNAGFLCLGWIVAIWFFSSQNFHVKIKNLVFSFLGILAGFILGSPYWVIKLSKFYEGLGMVMSQSKYAFNFETGAPYLWEIQKLISSEWLFGLLLILLLFSLFFHYKREIIPLTAMIIPTFLLVGSWQKKGLDYLLIIFPALLVIFLMLIDKYRQKFSIDNWLVYLLAPILILNGSRLFFYDFQKTHDDTREMAGKWIMQNYQPGTRICYDHYHYDIDLIDINRFLEYGEGSRYLNQNIRNKLEKLKDGSNDYSFISAQNNLNEIDLSDNMFTIVQNDTFLRQTFLHPHKTLDELKDEGVKLLILNSETYLKFTNNSPPDSSNPIRADFLLRRYFYQTVFRDLSPTKSFQPDHLHLGPVIKIYNLGENN
ncbi:MAG: glycosyltransferase family 39 protein [Calditrichota bacterium]